MAQLDKRNDDFIRMLLEVSGRARPADIQGVDEAQALELLQAYAAAHPERRLAIDGGVLSPAPADRVEPAPIPTEVPSHEMWASPPTSVQPSAGAGMPGTVSSPEIETPSWGYQQPADEQTDAQQPAVEYVDAGASWAGPAEPFAQSGDSSEVLSAQPEAVPEAPAPAPFEPPTPIAWQPTGDQVPAADDWQGSAEGYQQDIGDTFPDEQPLAWYWWLVPLFFSLLGGLVAWLILRQSQPKGAKKLLILGAIVFAVYVLISILMLVFGLGALMTSGTVGVGPMIPGYLTA